jgi:uncharacterized protein YbjT (DUF2867 family)
MTATALSVCVLGGTGFVGSELVARLAAGGHSVRVLTRNPTHGSHLAVLPTVEIVDANVHDRAALAFHFAGCDVAVNLVGILNERGRSGAGFQRAHAELAQNVVAAARSQRLARVLQMSALGADTAGPSHYLRSKGEAEAVIRTLSPEIDYSILRPSVIFGPGDSLLNRFADLLRLTGGFLPLARANARFAPIYVGDVAEAVMRALHGGAASQQTLQLCGPQVMTLADIVRVTAEVMGRRARILPLPDAVARVQAFVMDFLPGKPFSTDNYRSLSIDSVCQDDGCTRLGIKPVPLQAIAPAYIGGQNSESRLNALRAQAQRLPR